MMKKKILAWLLTLCLLSALLPGTALAAGNLPFRDVKPDDWFYKDVQYVYENSLMSGTGDTTFDPNGITTRGMIVSVLYRIEGRPEVSGGNSFRDVDPSMYCAKAITWASQNKIVSGYEGNRFGPNDSISREQMAAFLYRYAAYKGYDVSSFANLSVFPDAYKVSDWAWSQLSWANAVKLIQGTGKGELAPKDFAFRSQAASILARFCRQFVSEDPGSYTVTFDWNYPGAEAPSKVNVQAGQAVPAPADPSRSGYTFDGWYTAEEGGQRFSFDTAVMGDMTLYAHWTAEAPSRYTVTFHLNYPDAGVFRTESVQPGQVVPAPADPSRGGYTFGGWYTAAEGGERFRFDTAIMGDMTLYAHWTTAQTYTVSFDLNYPGSGVYKQEHVAEGNACPAPADPKRGDYIFGGWYTEAQDGVRYDFTAGVTGDMTLYAHWIYDGIVYAKPYQHSNYIDLYEGDDPLRTFSMMGRPYTQGLTMSAAYSGDTTEVLYSLEGKYRMMGFDIGSLDNNGTSSSTLYVYADGTLVDTIALTWNMPTYHYSLNVEGVTQLRFAREGRSSYGYGMANTILYTEADVEKEGLTVPAVSSLEAVLDSNLSSGAVLPYQNTGYITQYNGEDPLNTFSMMGNAYAQGLALEASYSGDTTEFMFNLGGRFEEFSAVIGHLDNKGTAAATINVYADGELVEQLPLTGNMACYTYTLNVQGVNQLRFTREGRSSYGYGLANITLDTESTLAGPLQSDKTEVRETNLSSGAVLPYQNTGYITQYNGEDPLNTFSMMGNAYAQGLALEASYSGDTTEFLFNLGGGFQEFSAVIGHLDNKGTSAATINVYADGELVEQLPLAGNMACYTYTLNVQGVNQLRFTREGRSSYGYGLANITLDTESTLAGPLQSDKTEVRETNLSSGLVLPYQNTGYITQYNGEDPLNTFSMMGNAYAQGLALEASYSGDTTEFLFNLGGGFQEFSAVIGHLDNKGTSDATLNVYADGELVEQIPLTGNMACYTYTLDVQGVNQLRFTREGRSSYGYGLANITLS